MKTVKMMKVLCSALVLSSFLGGTALAESTIPPAQEQIKKGMYGNELGSTTEATVRASGTVRVAEIMIDGKLHKAVFHKSLKTVRAGDTILVDSKTAYMVKKVGHKGNETTFELVAKH